MRVTRQGGAKLVVSEADTVVKVEVNTVLRGALLPVRELDLCEAAQDAFGRFVSTRVVSEGELFGGKLAAALDRQHPRDLFDTRFILDRINGQPDDDLRLGFLLMLLSHDRPPHEVLDPREQDPSDAFARQFAGMAREPFALDDHRRAFADLRAMLPTILPPTHRDALHAVVERADAGPFAALAGRPEAAALPAVSWKVENLRRLRERDPAKDARQVEALADVLASL